MTNVLASPAQPRPAVDLCASALVLLIPFSSFMGPSNSPTRLALIAATLIGLIALGIARRVFSQVGEAAPLIILSAFLLMVQTLNFQGDRLFFNYHVGLIIGLHALVIDRRRFAAVATAFLAVQFVTELYEYLTGTLLFNSVTVGGDIFDAETYGGNEGVFRAKGLADGPTSVGFFLLFMATMLRGNILAMTLIMACCFLSSARLGLVVIGTLYAVDIFAYLRRQTDRPFLLLTSIVAMILILILIVARLLLQDNAGFILQALDLQGNDNNVSRLDLIAYGLSYIGTMSPAELAFGSNFDLKNSGFVFESAWLGILSQAGVVMAGAYLWSLCRKSTLSWTEAHNRAAVIVASAVAGTFDPLGGSVLMFMALGQTWRAYNQARDGRISVPA